MNELKANAEINGEIKSIVCASENISLTATNAILIARQAGTNAVGFSMVARELRMFSEKMSVAMQGLSGLIYRQVEANASKCHRMRNLGLLAKAGSFGKLAQIRIAQACARSQADIDKIDQLIASQARDLQVRMRRTGKQCTTGLAIARSANIEAAYGGAMMPVLHRIAQDVEEVAGNISGRVKKLEARLAVVGL